VKLSLKNVADKARDFVGELFPLQTACSALAAYVSGNTFTHEPGGKVVGPITKYGTSTYRFTTRHDPPNVKAYDQASEFLPDLINRGHSEHHGHDIREFEMPASGLTDGKTNADLQRDSLEFHAKLFKMQNRKGEPLKEFSFTDEELRAVATRWPDTKDKWKDPLEHFDDLYQKAVNDIVKTSSSACSVSLGQTKGACLSKKGDEVKLLVYQRLLRMSSISLEDLRKLSPVELVQGGYCDPIRIFLKCEPHKVSKRYCKVTKEKLQQQRWRIISSVSLVDEILDRILYGKQNRAEIDNWNATPSMPGVGFSDDNSAEKFFSEVIEPQKEKWLMMLDFTGWDWGVKQGLLDMDARVRSILCGEQDCDMFLKRACTIGFSVFVLDNGETWIQNVRGVMKSGWYCTSSTNSRARVLVSLRHAINQATTHEERMYALTLFFVIAMGDDSVEEEHNGGYEPFRDALDDWGLRPDTDFKGNSVTFRDVEFCSHKFELDNYGKVKANLVNWKKSISAFLFLPTNRKLPEQIAGIRNALRHAPELPAVENMWRALYPKMWEDSFSCGARANIAHWGM